MRSSPANSTEPRPSLTRNTSLLRLFLSSYLRLFVRQTHSPPHPWQTQYPSPGDSPPSSRLPSSSPGLAHWLKQPEQTLLHHPRRSAALCRQAPALTHETLPPPFGALLRNFARRPAR